MELRSRTATRDSNTNFFAASLKDSPDPEPTQAKEWGARDTVLYVVFYVGATWLLCYILCTLMIEVLLRITY